MDEQEGQPLGFGIGDFWLCCFSGTCWSGLNQGNSSLGRLVPILLHHLPPLVSVSSSLPGPRECLSRGWEKRKPWGQVASGQRVTYDLKERMCIGSMTTLESAAYQRVPTDEAEAQMLASADLDGMKSEALRHYLCYRCMFPLLLPALPSSLAPPGMVSLLQDLVLTSLSPSPCFSSPNSSLSALRCRQHQSLCFHSHSPHGCLLLHSPHCPLWFRAPYISLRPSSRLLTHFSGDQPYV